MRNSRVVYLFASLLLAVASVLPVRADDTPTLKLLFLGDQGPHQPALRFAELQPAMASRGIDLVYTETVSSLDLENLKRYDALMLYANIDEVADEYADAVMEYVNGGGGFVPLHCASFCFRNQPELVALMGGQFKSHQTGVFRATPAEVEHPILQGYGGFRSWDETYVHHLHNEQNRTILEYRVDADGREPWTWVRTQGEGRVFYTAWGHDGRTWSEPGFQNLVERGIRWVVGQNPTAAGVFMADRDFDVPEMTNVAGVESDFDYVDVGKKIPNYTPSDRWGVQGEPLNLMQKPLPPQQSMKHFVVPEGFHVELFVAEPDLKGKPITMAWDERGRLWVAETYDYPNELQASNRGRDKIRICEDTDGNGRADKFTVFAEDLSIPTAIAFTGDGVLVQNGTETLLLNDTDGDDVADQRETVITGWELGDTHGGVSNFQYGLDNWIWAMQGYNNSQPIARGEPQSRFRMGFFRMRPDVSEVEFIRSTNNNTWGLGISEDGLIFGSTANGNPSIYMPIANRYYERVRGWTPSLTLSSIADSNDFEPITDKVRQVDHHGGYTAAAGHALYTGRVYPQQYWNRTAFVAGPTGHLVGSFVLERDGADFKSTSPFNLIASDDEWSAPIMAEVGPDGTVWVIDWYNYIVQHNPTPQGFETGKGNAYETDLRDKKHGRIYRIVPDSQKVSPTPNLAQASEMQLVDALTHPTLLVRKHAQRLLVQRQTRDARVVQRLIKLIKTPEVDAIGLNVGAIHGLWTLHGMGLLDGSHDQSTAAAITALSHPSAGVRRNALAVLPPTPQALRAMLDAGVTRDIDPQVRLAAFLAISDASQSTAAPIGAADSNAVGNNLVASLSDPRNLADRWIPDAITSAAAMNARDFLTACSTLRANESKTFRDRQLEILTVVADHLARGDQASEAPAILTALADAPSDIVKAIVLGLNRGWQSESKVALDKAGEDKLESLIRSVDGSARGTLVRLADRWGSDRLAKFADEIVDRYFDQLDDEAVAVAKRVDAANQIIEFKPDDTDTVTDLLDTITPQTNPELAAGIVTAVARSTAEGAGDVLVESLAAMTPSLKVVAIRGLLSRPAMTEALLSGIESGSASLTDLALDQKQALASHPRREIRRRAAKILQQGGALPSPDRQKILDTYAVAAHRSGDVARGKAIFKEQCSKCHVHSGEGNAVGPDLTGMAVHPKDELLIHILDPSRSVEGNFRAYSVLTVDGVIVTGMLTSESKTTIELFDTQGKKQSVLRDDIEQLVASKNSIMPEGFEKSIDVPQMADLLEFLTDRGKFFPLDLRQAATAPSDRSLFVNPNSRAERLVLSDWAVKTFAGVPFHVVDPIDGKVPNVIVLHSPNGPIARRMPRQVTLPVGGSAKAIHMLSGIAGWGFPAVREQVPALTVRLHYADGQHEDQQLINGVHFADYIRRVDVPESQFAFDTGGGQVRYLTVVPKRNEVIDSIELIDANESLAPVVMAITVESTK